MGEGILASTGIMRDGTGRDGTVLYGITKVLGTGMHLCIRALRLCIADGGRASLVRRV